VPRHHEDLAVLLDEVGDMPAPLQVKLLRALQEREIKRVGSNKVIKINPRVISATNKNIEEELKAGTIREDFYYRIAVITLGLAPLRERPQDIEVLTQFYIDHFSVSLGKQGLELDRTAKDMIRAYNWPGNARELENVMERAVILADGVIKPEHLGINISINFQALDDSVRTLSEIAGQAARRAEIDLITRTLAQTMNNKSKAAQILGVSYKTLLNKVKEYNLGPAQEHVDPGLGGN
jgi:two-component system response regulator HydG